jgi:uncharacterized protein (DUF58 family)
MVTARGAAFLVGAVLLWAVGRLLGVAELYVVSAATGALVAAAAGAVRLGSSTVSVRRGVTTSRLAHGGTAEVTIDLRNDARWDPVSLLLVEDHCHWTLADQPRFVVSGVRPREVVHLSYPIRGSHRGRYTVGPLQLRVRDPFGAVEQVRRYTSTDEVIVHPKVEVLPSGLTRGTHLGSGSSDERRLYNTGDEFHTMREYVQGDDLRLVHWPSTAKQNTLMVRQQELPWQAEATVLLDTRALAHRGAGPDSTFEKAVSAAASVVWHLAGHGYRLRLTTDSDRQPPPVESWAELLDRLAVIDLSGEQTFVGLTALRRSGAEGLLVAVVTPPAGDEPVSRHPELRALVQAGRSFPSRAAVVVYGAHTGAGRAEETAALLRVASWRATTVGTDESLAEHWGELTPNRARGAAYQPDAVGTP